MDVLNLANIQAYSSNFFLKERVVFSEVSFRLRSIYWKWSRKIEIPLCVFTLNILAHNIICFISTFLEWPRKLLSFTFFHFLFNNTWFVSYQRSNLLIVKTAYCSTQAKENLVIVSSIIWEFRLSSCIFGLNLTEFKVLYTRREPSKYRFRFTTCSLCHC